MGLQISRILHAGYIFECDGTQVAFDPIFENPFSRNCHAFPQVQFDDAKIENLKLSAVFISHFHDDHCSLESLNLLDRKTPIYVYCLFEELFAMIRELGFHFVHRLEIDVPIQVGSMEIIPRKALDAEVDSLFQIKAQGLNVLNVVDSWIDDSTLDQLSKESAWDMVLWPFQTMRETDVLAPRRALPASLQLPPEWLEQLKVLNPRYVVPSSCQFIEEPWSWYNHALFPITYRQFQKEVEQALPQAQVVRLNPSISVILTADSLQFSNPLDFVLPVGEQEVDYELRSELIPPKTADIAQKFAPLSLEQTERVFQYCQSELIEKYNSMDPPLDPYFDKPRTWRLSVFDHTGAVTDFHYQIKAGQMKPVEPNSERLSWTTEIPIARFYGALEHGESLTSLYIRINDIVFDAEIEKEIQLVDVIEDPLVRCLFHDAFGAYQAAQLRTLKEQGRIRPAFRSSDN